MKIKKSINLSEIEDEFIMILRGGVGEANNLCEG